MGDALYFLILAGGAAGLLCLAFLFFELVLFTVYKLSGGRLNLLAYLEKM